MSGLSSQRGVTLIELVVALAVLSLVAAVVVFTLPASQSPARGEAERFAARLSVAMEEAALAGAPMRVSLSAQGYEFETWRNDAWEPAGAGRRARAPDGRVIMTASVDEPARRNEPAGPRGDQETRRIVLDPLGPGASFAVDFASGRERWRVGFDETGAISVTSHARD